MTNQPETDAEFLDWCDANLDCNTSDKNAALTRALAIARRAAPSAPDPFEGHCCVPRAGEPFFVLLGRDKQAPAVVEKWAADREAAKPGDDKIAGARETAAAMRAYSGVSAPAAPADDVERIRRVIKDVIENAREGDEAGQFVLNDHDAVEDGTDSILAAMPSARSDDGRQDNAPPLTFTYRNHRGEVAERRGKPLGIRHGSTEWHPEPQWLLRAYDLDKQAEREFAMKDIGGDAGRLSGLREAAEIVCGYRLSAKQLEQLVARGRTGLLKTPTDAFGFARDSFSDALRAAASQPPAERYPAGMSCTVPECVFQKDSVAPVAAVIKSVEADGRYIVTTRGEDLWVTHGEITPTPATGQEDAP